MNMSRCMNDDKLFVLITNGQTVNNIKRYKWLRHVAHESNLVHSNQNNKINSFKKKKSDQPQ